MFFKRKKKHPKKSTMIQYEEDEKIDRGKMKETEITEDFIIEKLQENDEKIEKIINAKKSEIPRETIVTKTGKTVLKPVKDKKVLQQIHDVQNMRHFFLSIFEELSNKKEVSDEDIAIIEDKINKAKCLFSLHDTKRNGKIDELTYTIIVNAFDWTSLLMMDSNIPIDTPIKEKKQQLIETMYNNMNILMMITKNNINLVSKILTYMLEDCIFQAKNKKQNVFDVQKMKEVYDNLSPIERQQWTILPISIIGDLLGPQVRVERHATLFSVKEKEPSHVYDIDINLRKNLE